MITHEEVKIAFSKVYASLSYGDKKFEDNLEVVNHFITQQEKKNTELTTYAKHLAKMYVQYRNLQYTGKNGANSDNEKGYWRGMADAVLAMLADLKAKGLISHTGVHNDDWPAE